MLTKQEASELIGSEIADRLNRGEDPTLAPSPARDVPRVDPITADVERFARFLFMHRDGMHRRPVIGSGLAWEDLLEPTRGAWRDAARAMVRDFDELEEILAEIMVKGGRF